MRKIIAALLFLNLLFSSHAFAKPGDVAGYIYSTDILAYVNGKPVQSYNIGGKTAVIVEELDSYGFEYWYDGEGRILTINSKQNAVYGDYEIERDVPGKIAGNVYETDIKVIFNAQEIKGYNIGGRTAVCIEDLGTVESDSPNLDYGYSKYLCNFKWDSDKRNVYLNSFGAKARAMKDYLPPKIFVQKRDNTISFKFDQMNEVYSVGSANYSDEFLNDTYKLKPILHNGEKIGTMYIDWKGRVYSDIDERKVYKIVKDLPDVLSFEEAVSYIEENFDIIDTCENEKAKYFLAEKEGEQWRFLLYAQKTKGLVVELADSEAIFKDDAKGNTYLSWHGAGTPGSGIVEMMWYFMEAEEVDFDEWKKYIESWWERYIPPHLAEN